MDSSGNLPRVLEDFFPANRQNRQMFFWVFMILGDEAQAPWWIASPISPPRLCKIILISTNCWVSTCDFLHYFRVSLLDSHHSMPDSNHFYICFLGFSCIFFWIFLDFLGDNPCSVSLPHICHIPTAPPGQVMAASRRWSQVAQVRRLGCHGIAIGASMGSWDGKMQGASMMIPHKRRFFFFPM